MMRAEKNNPAGVDGVIEPSVVADCFVEGIKKGDFLILPHAEVKEYMKRKADDTVKNRQLT